MNISANISPLQVMIDDLAKSGLKPEDMLARWVDADVLHAVNANMSTQGYVIPYFNMAGKILPYYRVKVIGGQAKYLQIKNMSNHVYFPKNFWEVWEGGKFKVLLMTEGEKKAAACCKIGIPCVAFGGVDSWRNRTIVVPKSSEIHNLDNAIGIKLPSADFDERWMSPYAAGLDDLMDVCRKHQTTMLICYDSDLPSGVATQPQRAAAKLGYELRFQGFPIQRIRQLILPHDADTGGALDGHIVKFGGPNLLKLIQDNLDERVAFPRHPSLRAHISKQLQKLTMDRKQLSALGLSIITEMDARGSRMYSPDDKQMYYFDGDTRHLMKVNLNNPNPGQIHETEFGMLLYKEYGIAPKADQKVMQWLGAQFSAEDPVEMVEPHRVIARHNPSTPIKDSILRYQINNGQYIKVTGDEKNPYKILPNGAENILFESQTEDLDEKRLIKEIQAIHKDHQSKEHVPFWWDDVLKDVRLERHGKYSQLIALLYYISPWLLRWRGLQLPVELVVGEAGSGKSTLCTLRMEIVHGKANADLRNTPNDQKDWYAAIANSGGLHITDNVHMTDKNLKQRISDDLCRIVTEPDPRIRIRKYFTEADERSIRVSSVFGFTAITQPFPNGDLLQRSLIMELAKNSEDAGDVVFDSYWKDRQIQRFGGRERWIAHHLYVIHRFFREARTKWDNNYKSKHRLIGFEQSLVILGEMFGLPEVREWIPQVLSSETYKAIESADWALEGLTEFAESIKQRQIKKGSKIVFDTAEIATWAESHDGFRNCYQLINPKSLGRYISANRHNILHVAGIREISKKANRAIFEVVSTPPGEK